MTCKEKKNVMQHRYLQRTTWPPEADAFQPGNQGELGYVLTAQPTKWNEKVLAVRSNQEKANY